MTATEFENIVLQIRPKMLRVALDFFHNEEDAEDAVQNVLFKMWKREWKPNDNITALAIRATKNECVSMARKHRLRIYQPIEEAGKITSTQEADQDILTHERRMMIEQSISSLSRSEQRIIRLAQDKGLNAEEIAMVTGIKLPSVRSMLSMIRKKLINKLSI